MGGKGEESPDLGLEAVKEVRRDAMTGYLEHAKILAGPAHEQNSVGAGKVDHGHGVRPGRLDGRVIMEVGPCVRVWDLMDGVELEVARVVETEGVVRVRLIGERRHGDQW